MKTIATRSRALLLLGFLTMPYQLSAADGAEYHLTGIMGSDPGMAFAVIEDADGNQKLLSEGSAIGTGYVKSISSEDRTVVLALPDGEISLRLTGSARPVETVEKKFSLSDYSEVIVQKPVNPAAVEQLATLAGNADKLSDKQLAAQVNAALGLPAQARIAAYNQKAVDSPRDLLERMGDHISNMSGGSNSLGSIAVTDNDGSRRMYLSAEAPAN